ncbi:MAG: type I-E CRISPR-associated protein Cas5/CasD [Syntrophobacterales bacterium]|nr:type I-E CRISPR-associated protein Cas5/CasD [Syntrophobacterales bacterium]
MSTLLLRLAGPLQSWGVQSRFTERDTLLEPSKSGVVGLLAAALGRKRDEPVSDLAALRMGVRVDREGVLRMDYHTAGGTHRQGEKYGVALADGSSTRPVTSRRYYLADADFLVGLEGEDEDFLCRLDAALARPVWPLYLGRKAFVPGTPIRINYRPKDLPGPAEVPGLVHLPLEETLRRYPLIVRTPREAARRRRELEEAHRAGQAIFLRLVLEAEPGSTAEVRPDQPLSFAILDRQYTLRYVRTTFHKLRPEMIMEVPHVSVPCAA